MLNPKRMMLCVTLLFLSISGANVTEASIYNDIKAIIFNEKVETPVLNQIQVVEQKTPQEYITLYSEQFEADPNLLLKIGQCESADSELDVNAKGDYKNGVYLAIGLYQYHDGTWEAFEKIYRKEYLDEDLDKFSYHDQIKLTSFIFAKHPELRKRWTSYVAYANGGTYTFWSRLLQKKFTVICK